MDNQDHKVEFLNELSQEFERDQDADGIQVEQATFRDLLQSLSKLVDISRFSSASTLMVAAYKMGMEESDKGWKASLDKALGGSK